MRMALFSLALASLLELTPDQLPAQHAEIPQANGTDAAFVSGMIAHHAQAVTMAALVPSRTSRGDLRLLAERIDVSQRDEIAMLRRWLAKRQVSDEHAGHHVLMPGMLTEQQLAELGQAKGPQFDRLFLEDMIRHHEGAITMVAELLASKDGGKEPEIFSFATGVDADQRAEIRRMRAMLSTP